MKRGLLVYRPDDGEGGDGGAVGAWEPPPGLEQFKTPEDLAKSYMELRPEMDRMRSEMERERQQFAETLSSLNDVRETPAPNGNGQPQFDPSVAAWGNAIEQGDYAQAMQIAQQSMQQPLVAAVGNLLDERFQQLQPAMQAQEAAQRQTMIQMAEDLVARTLGPEQYEALLPAIKEQVAANPHYLPAASSVEGYRDAILNVAKLADYDAQRARVEAFEQDRAEKLSAATMTGSGRVAQVATGDVAKQEFDRIKNTPTGSYSELMNRGTG